MIFKVTATVLKELWSSGDSYLYSVQERISADRTKNWTIFTKSKLSVDAEAVFEGYISESKDKKLKDQNGKDIWRTAFNAESVILTTEVEPHFDDSQEVPF
jgi:hypothetical protein